jgi:hypothetical protein
MGYHADIESARKMASTILGDPSDSFEAVAIVPGYDDGEGYDCYPLRYYDVCPGAHADADWTVAGLLTLVQAKSGLTPVEIISPRIRAETPE